MIVAKQPLLVGDAKHEKILSTWQLLLGNHCQVWSNTKKFAD